MNQEEKKLLLVDLCSRLTYNVKAYVRHYAKLDRKWYEETYTVSSVHPSLNEILVSTDKYSVEVLLGHFDYEIKPYLFPMSSMTEEQKKEFIQYAVYDVEDTWYEMPCECYLIDYVGTPEKPICNYAAIDWLNKHHFDYRGLIDKDLAIDATGLDIY